VIRQWAVAHVLLALALYLDAVMFQHLRKVETGTERLEVLSGQRHCRPAICSGDRAGHYTYAEGLR